MAKRKKKWIAGAIKRPGVLTRKAKAAGMSVSEFIANPPKDITAQTRRQINLAKTLKKLGRQRKKKG
jgi:hypothetical protein